MRIIRKSSEAEMVTAFVAAEISSSRFQKRYAHALKGSRNRKAIVLNPDLSSKSENSIRAAMLRRARGYGANRKLFKGYPQKIRWSLVELTRQELGRCQLMNWQRFIAVTNGSRKICDVDFRRSKLLAEHLKGPVTGIMRALRKGEELPPIIALRSGPRAKTIVIIEGSARSIAMFRSRRALKVKVLLGESPAVARMSAVGINPRKRSRYFDA